MTPTDLYDWLQEQFGIGTYDPGSTDQAYWEYRVLEVTKLKAMIRRRRTSVEELFMAAEYAKAQRIHVRAPFELLGYIAPAKRALRHPRHQDGREALNLAVIEAQASGMDDWAVRLYNADPSVAADVLAEFEAAKSHG